LIFWLHNFYQNARYSLSPKRLRRRSSAFRDSQNTASFFECRKFRALETERKTLQTRTEELQSQRNSLSKQIGILKAKGESTDQVMADVASIKTELDASALRLDALQAEIQDMLLAVPNLPHESVPLVLTNTVTWKCVNGVWTAKDQRHLTLKCATT
jgi:seryl-tRNA synthetase